MMIVVTPYNEGGHYDCNGVKDMMKRVMTMWRCKDEDKDCGDLKKSVTMIVSM